MWANMGQYLVSGVCYENIIFYSHTEFAGDIHARLNSDNLACFEPALAVGLEERHFVYFQTEAMSRPVAINRQTAAANNVPRSGINLLNFGTGLYHFYRGGLCLLYGIISPFKKWRRLAYCKGPCNIAAIAFMPGPEIYQYRVSSPELSLTRLMMGTRSIRAKGNYCLEAVCRP